MAVEYIVQQTGDVWYNPGNGILTRLSPGAGLGPTGLWLPFRLDSVGNLMVSQGPLERDITAAALSSIAASLTSTQVVAANPNRNGLMLYNNSNSTCYVAFAASASQALFTELLDPGSTYEMTAPIYPGVVSAVWDAANGSLQVTEF